MSDTKLNQPSSEQRTAGSLEQVGMRRVAICCACDWWTPTQASNALGLTGWCDVFCKRTQADHGRKCTAWTPLQPHTSSST